jgi:Protein of unknown function (DUF2905)
MDPGKALIVTGAFCIAAGLIWLAGSRFGLGHLPGDIMIERGNLRFYFPLGTSILISLILTAVFWLIGRL